MKTRISNIVKETRFMDSKSYNNLSPKMKEAIKEIYKLIENEQKDIVKNFEGAVDKVSQSHKINTEILYNYFNKEVNEQLGVK